MKQKEKAYLLLIFGVFTLAFFGAWLTIHIVTSDDCKARERECYISPLDANGACAFYDIEDLGCASRANPSNASTELIPFCSTRCAIVPCPFNEFDVQETCWVRLEGDNRKCLEESCTISDFLVAMRILFNVLWGLGWGACLSLGMNILMTKVDST